MSKRRILKVCATVALLAGAPAVAFAQDNTAVAPMPADPAMNAMAADPAVTNVVTAGPMANDLGTTTTTDPMLDNPPVAPVERDDNDFPWGLLGLLGLGGLMGRKRNDNYDRVDRDINSNKRV